MKSRTPLLLTLSDDSAIIDIEGEVACLKSGQDEEHLTYPSAVPSAKQLRPFKILRIKSSDALLALDIVDTADIIKDYQVPIVGGPRYTEEAILYIDEIGRGSTSKVYKCIYVPTLSFVAVKTISISNKSQLKSMEVELRALHSVGSSGGTCPKGRVFESIEQEIKLDLSTLTEILEDITDLRKIESVISDSKNLSVDQWVHTYGMGVETPTYYDHLTGLEGARQSTPAPLTLMLPREKVAQCPYIIAFYDSYVDVEKGSVCLVLEHMGGGSLQDLIDGMRRPSEADVAVVAYSVLRALDELNTKKLLHRDIKPSNILIKGDGAVKLSDFGITFELDCDHAPQTFTGTMCYMSPERIRGEEYGKAGDIWSLGISLVVFITGKSPFAEVKGFWNILDSFQKGAPSTAMRGTSDCSPELNEFLDMCLVRDPELRPDTTMLLQSRFIQKATREGTIQPFQQPKLSGLRSNVTSISKIHATVTAVVNWLPEHLNDMVFLTPSTNLDSIYINIDNSASPISVSKTPRPFTASSDAPMSNQSRITAHMITVSSKAVDRLAFLLGSTFSDVIRIIISHHPAACLRNRAQYVNGTGNEDEKDYKKKYFSNSISMSLSTPTKRCNPLFPYICQDGLHSSL